MASLWKDRRSPHFIACFDVYVGQSLKQYKKSTATRDRKLAGRIADELEEAGQGRRDREQIFLFLKGIEDLRARRAAHRAFDDVLRKTTGNGLASKTARGFINAWAARTQNEVSEATWAKYDQTARIFLESLAGKADQDMNLIRQDDVARFRDTEAKRVAVATANVALKIVRIMFSVAEADGVLMRNEAKHVKLLKNRGETSARRAFTLPELKRVLDVCDDEWRSLVLFGFYTGARLGDLARLTWQNIDLAQNELRYLSRKTGRPIVIPLAETLRAQLDQMPAGDDPKQPLHPRAFEIVVREGRTGTLSNQFGDILAQAGLVEPRTHKANPEKGGRTARRALADVSFHSLRHTAVSLLKSAGVSDAVARDLVGHESQEVSRLYTHIEDKAKNEAVNKLPVIGRKE